MWIPVIGHEMFIYIWLFIDLFILIIVWYLSHQQQVCLMQIVCVIINTDICAQWLLIK